MKTLARNVALVACCSLAVTLVVVFSRACLAAEPAANASTLVEHVSKKPRRVDGTLGTSLYKPSKGEQPYFKKLNEDERTTGGLAGDYDIRSKGGNYVGWFGIVRKVNEDKAAGQTTLTIEHKYFDGLTDTHIMAVSFNGSGDFRAVLRGAGHEIEPLTLVKVYGVASDAAPGEPPQVQADFARNWHWGTFTFLFAAGEQRGSEEWRKLNTVDLDDIYDPYPDDEYYKQRLGDKPD